MSLSDSRGAGLRFSTPTIRLELSSVFPQWCKLCALCSDGKVVCIHKAGRALVNRLVVCVYVENKWREDTPLR